MKKYKRTYIQIIAMFLVIFSIISYYYIEVSIKPTLKSICEVNAKVIATQIINSTVREEIEKDELKEQILIPTYDNDGKINMIRTDALVMNKISSNIAKSVQDKIVNLENQSFKIPLFSALDNQLLSNRGPDLKFTIFHQGSVIVDFITEFEESGINQTRYKIYITVSVDMRIISPATTSSITVSNNLLIAEIVIVGEVPDSYMSFPSLREAN
ncbi:sporulation protein YunB [Sedimentibacter sp. MB31-C6]|uniref:sporulation protein YunB n=1 Tax=Sedimentibacter sp. MB31-C6 TaxID=3109366 RepID=UPI002DDDAE52|nr:sporulation protein YunB [Sedimentibacter sp. MB36-C1]WSI03965.1 sporulation protein YunB [Sedimentibacter sp. MB36-C1]